MKFFFTFVLLSLLSPFSFSQNKNFRNEFGFRSDNDAYLAYGQDRYYTNGLFITMRHAIKSDSRQSSRLAKKIWEIEAGQYMYNAQSGSVPNISYIDRPFAAYLYGGAKLNWLMKNEQVFQVSVNGGAIGPAALGKDAQKVLHKIVGFYEVNGWQYQVNNEFGINTEFNYSRLLYRTGTNTDFSFSGYGSLGNTFSGAGAGIVFRAGNINKLFSSVMTNSRISNSSADSVPAKEIFFFAKPSLHFIAYDATIQGGMFNEDKGPVTFTPNRLAFSQELGVKYAGSRWTLNFSVIFRTKEIKTQVHAHQYGSASIYYRFGAN